MWLKLNLTQLDLAQDWKSGDHHWWPRCWPRTIQQIKKKCWKTLICPPEGFWILPFNFLQEMIEIRESVRFLTIYSQKGLWKSQKRKKGSICLWMTTLVTEWYHREREKAILTVNQYTCGTSIRSSKEEFGFSMVNVITFYGDLWKIHTVSGWIIMILHVWIDMCPQIDKNRRLNAW